MSEQDKKLLEFEVARENRRFEIQMFWQRSNYFLALNSALGIALFAIKGPLYLTLISGVGIVCSLLWFRTNVGAKFWQKFWEAEVHELAKGLDMKAFALTDDEIMANTRTFGRTDDKTFLKRFVDREIEKKPSVSYNMILLSLFAVFCWCALTAINGLHWISHLLE